MIRNTILAVVVGAMVSAAAVVVRPDGDTAVAQIAQTGDGVTTAAFVELSLGERYSTELWDLEARSAFLAPSPEQGGITEVRIEMVARNNLDEPIPFTDTAFVDNPFFPDLVLVDGAGVDHPYRVSRMRRDAVPQSTLHGILPGMTGAWTIGFRVPTGFADGLRLVIRDLLGNDIVAWNLDEEVEPESWPPPPLQQIGLGQTFPWGDGLRVTPTDHGSFVCGDPDSNFVTHIFALEVDVSGAGAITTIEWPGVRFPDFVAVAQWGDGASAVTSVETYSGNAEVLRKPSFDSVLIPAGSERPFRRALLFGVSRDARLVDVDEPPVGVRLTRPDGSALWVELDGGGELAINPAFCDDGFFPAPVPYAFAPSHRFLVGPAGPVADPVELDRATEELLGQALIIAGRYYIDNGDSFAGVDADALEDVWPLVDFADGAIDATLGLVGIDSDLDDEIILTTQSATGTYFCAGVRVGNAPQSFSGDDLALLIEQCTPADEDEVPPPDDGTGDGTGDEHSDEETPEP